MGKKQKDTSKKVAKDSIPFSEDVVVCLLRGMKTVGYGDLRRARKSMKESFKAAVAEAKKKGVDRTALARERKFSRLKCDYSKFGAEKSNFRVGGESTLHRKPPYFEQM